MDQVRQRRHIAEIAELLAEGTTAMAETPLRVPIDTFTSSERLAAERHVLFRRYPLIVGVESAVPSPGDFFTEVVAGLPILVVRGQDGVLQAFVNVCRHRGKKLCLDASGNRRSFVCPFHAWTYDNSGKSRTFVDRKGFEGLDLEDYSLIPLPLEVRHGFIWVTPDPSGEKAMDLSEFLGPSLDAELVTFEPHTKYVYNSETTQVNFNWKLGVDTFQEIFHLAFLHKNTLGKSVLSNITPYEKFGPHHRLTVVRSTFTEMLTKPEFEQDLFSNAALVYTIFPNTVLVWQLDHWEMWNFYPVGDRDDICQAKITLLLDKAPDTERLARRWEKNWELTRRTVYTEDFEAGVTIQSSITAGVPSHLVYGRNEIALQDFHLDIDEALMGVGENATRNSC
ncbi:SRPBCC family protein [Xanthobacter autotrophicus]|uniref:aromatic ring-hydroxylating oxygenase subunit alpha n=1 Tax=Xanthobacter autotrophicus TaxID=280 RepID=UPI00372B8BDF